ncbi:MAG: DegT/DnrJ/EryC1/StrS aminotransferase family protein [Actinomycetia bacterium]|nr:DegT/DnrJ/EryC1/StrS aminotransferase family protein [Actinomycetes bacterium]
MLIYAEALPKYKDILKGLLLPHPIKSGEQNEPFGYYYGFGRKAIFDAGVSISGSNNGEIWFPAYICDDLIQIFRKKWQGQIKFYDIKDDFSPDFDSIKSDENSENKSSIFVLVHYFGFPNSKEKVKEFCSLKKMHLIEDGAHVFPDDNIQDKLSGDAFVFSLRKIFPLPDGALLFISEKNKKTLNKKKIETGIPLQWIIRVILKRIYRYIPATIYGLKPIIRDDMKPEEEVEGFERGITKISLCLFNNFKESFEQIKTLRRDNYLLLQNRLIKAGIKPILKLDNSEVCPFVFAFKSKNRDGIIKSLRNLGIAAQFWPTLPVEIRESNLYPVAKKIQSELVILPVHQELSLKDMEFIVNSMKKVKNHAG